MSKRNRPKKGPGHSTVTYGSTSNATDLDALGGDKVRVISVRVISVRVISVRVIRLGL